MGQLVKMHEIVTPARSDIFHFAHGRYIRRTVRLLYLTVKVGLEIVTSPVCICGLLISISGQIFFV